MADASKSIQVNISVVVDQAKSALSEMAATVNQTTQTLEKMGAGATAGTAGITDGMEKASASTTSFFGNIVAGVLTANVAYDLFKKAAGDVIGLFKDSISAAMDESATMAQVKVDVDNAGLAYAQVGPQIEALSEKNTKFGFTNNETSLSMGKLILATGDYNQALKLNALAMDLSRAKNIDLDSSTTLIQQVMAGNTRVLKQYGISLDSATTSAEALNILHQKLQGSFEAFAETPAGKLKEITAQWDKMQEQIGGALMPVVLDLFTEFEKELPAITEFLTGMAKVTETVITDFIEVGKDSGVFDVIAVEAKNVYNYLKQVADAIGAVVDEVHLLTGTTDSYAKSQQEVSAGQKQVIDQWNEMHPKAQITIDQWKQMDEQIKLNVIHSVDAAQKTGELGKAAGDAGVNFDDVTNRINAANNVMIKHSDAVEQLSTEYDKMNTTGQKDLADLADSFVTNMATINKTITDTQQKIADLNASYAETQKSDTASVADSIVASSNKIADIKKQLAAATTDSQRQSLQDQLTAEQANYDSSLQFRLTHIAEIQTAQARANETDLQRTIDDFNTKEQKAKEAYDKQIAQLNAQLSAAQKEANDEEVLFTKKVTAINLLMKAANDYFDKLSADRLATTTAEVDAEIKKFQDLATQISATKSMSALQMPTASSTPLKGFAGGGSVSGGEPIMVGENGPEVFMPNVSGSIVPNERVSAMGGQTVININNPSVRSDNDITMIISSVTDALSRRDELARMGAYK